MTKNKPFKVLAFVIIFLIVAPFSSNIALAAKSTSSESSTPDGPEIVSEAAIVMDYDTNEIIYEKNANEQMYLASTSKLMTALLFAENASKKDSIKYTEDALAQPPYTMNSEQMKPTGKSLKVGDTLNADTVMKELLLFSANDAAYMVADSVAPSTKEFVDMMNKKATKLGLKNTYFGNPNGLPGEDGNDVNYSTAYELALIAKEAFKNDWIRSTMQLSDAKVTLPGDTVINLTNRNTELNKNGNIGGKTGVTDNAGTCFAGVYERKGKKYVTVVLKCDRNDNNARFVDLKDIVDYSEDAKKVVYKKSGKKVGSVNLEYKLFRFFGPTKKISAPIVLSENAKIYDNDINHNEAKISFKPSGKNAWQVASDNNQKLTLSIKDYSTSIKGNIKITTGEILKANIGIYLATVAVIIIVIVLILMIIKLIKSSGRKRKRSYYRR